MLKNKKKTNTLVNSNLSINNSLCTEIQNYLIKTRDQFESIQKAYSEFLVIEKSSFINIQKNMQRLYDMLNEGSQLTQSSVARDLKQIVNNIRALINRFDSNKGECSSNPSLEIKPSLEAGDALLSKFNDKTFPSYSVEKVSEKQLEKEQSISATQINFDENNKFHNFLISIRNYCEQERYISKNIFFSYAWPKKDKLQERWTRNFILTLAKHLRETGLTVNVDQQQSGAGTRLKEFMDSGINAAECVVVFSTRTMDFKTREDGLSGACFEQTTLMKRLRRERDALPRFIIPVLLNKEDHSPGLVAEFAEVSFYNDTYLEAFLNLIFKIYGLGDEAQKILLNQMQSLFDSSNILLSDFLSSSSNIQFKDTVISAEQVEQPHCSDAEEQEKGKEITKTHSSFMPSSDATNEPISPAQLVSQIGSPIFSDRTPGLIKRFPMQPGTVFNNSTIKEQNILSIGSVLSHTEYHDTHIGNQQQVSIDDASDELKSEVIQSFFAKRITRN
jgi:hypothetical protein